MAPQRMRPRDIDVARKRIDEVPMNEIDRQPLTEAERTMLSEAIDSHIYWQLAGPHYRSNGAVREPGSDDPAVASEIEAFLRLQENLEARS